MKIKTKLALRFALIIGSILLLFSITIYYFSSAYQLKEFKSRLKYKAINTGIRLVNLPEIDSSLLARMDKITINQLYDETREIYDYNNKKLLYYFNEGKTPFSSTISIINTIKKNGQISYSEGQRDVVGILYPKDNPKFIIICSAIDFNGIKDLNNLKLILIISLVVSLIIIIISALFYSREALKPISKIIMQMDNITASHLHSRVIVDERKDEIAALALTFNNMIDRIEEAFNMQKNFVSHASHELRTPLTSIKGQIDVALMRARDIEEYISILNSINSDIQILTELTNGFLDMAESGMDDHKLKTEKIRVDDVLFYVKNEFREKHNKYNINISFENTIDDDSKLILHANLSLLKILFYNLIDNACKFSDNKSVNVIISTSEQFYLIIYFIDNGIGIPESEINKITEPFYRASNISGKSGYGIGLSIVKQIVSLHNGQINITSELNKGSTVKLTFLN